MKYVVYVHDRLNFEVCAVFPDFINERIITSKISSKIVSVGYCKIVDNKFEVCGAIVSSGLPTRPTDTTLLNEQLF